MSREAGYQTVESVPRRIFLQWWAGEVSWCENRIDEGEHLDVEFVHVDDYAALEAENERLEVAIRLVLPHLVPTHRVFKRLAAALEEGGDGGEV